MRTYAPNTKATLNPLTSQWGYEIKLKGEKKREDMLKLENKKQGMNGLECFTKY